MEDIYIYIMGDNYINKIHGSLIQDIVLTKRVDSIDTDISDVKTAVEEVTKVVEKVETSPFKNVSIAFTTAAWSTMQAMTAGATTFINSPFVLAGITYNGVDYIFNHTEDHEKELAAAEDAFARALLADGLITEDRPSMGHPADDFYVKVDHVLESAGIDDINGVKPTNYGFNIGGQLIGLSFYLSDGKYVMDPPTVALVSGIFADAWWIDRACHGVYAINSCIDSYRALNVYCIKAAS